MAYEPKTKVNEASVREFLDAVEHPARREDAFALLDLMTEVTGDQPKMWGDSIVGFGRYHYEYATGHEGNMLMTGFSPRKANLVIYNMPGFERYEAQMSRLGKYKTGKSCLYINKLKDIDVDVLRELIELSVDQVRAGHQSG